jgi:hypothetical protein
MRTSGLLLFLAGSAFSASLLTGCATTRPQMPSSPGRSSTTATNEPARADTGTAFQARVGNSTYRVPLKQWTTKTHLHRRRG